MRLCDKLCIQSKPKKTKKERERKFVPNSP